MPDESKSQALTTRPQRAWSLVPSSMGEAREIAEIIAASDFAPKDYKGKPGNVMIATQMGLDVGLNPMQALQGIAVINGRPSIWGDSALALCMPALERFVEFFEGEKFAADGKTYLPGYTAVCISRRMGWPDETKRTFSVADAIRAGLWGKTGPWTNYPDRMLQMRARGFNLRDAAPDRLMGLVLTEEAQDYPALDAHVVRVETVDAQSDATLRFEQSAEALRTKVGEAFAHLTFSPAQQLIKINEYFIADRDPDESATALIEWCKDEFAKRKFGKPRRASGDNGRKAQPTAEDKAADAAKPVAATVVDITAKPSPKDEPTAKVEPTTAPTAAEIF